VGFLIGFLSQSRPDEAYIRLVAVHPEQRGAGVGRALYERFFAVTRERGRAVVRSVTSPGNQASVAFHARLGFVSNPRRGHGRRSARFAGLRRARRGARALREAAARVRFVKQLI
jgi:predicted GNAT superfamily acetyltransferase